MAVGTFGANAMSPTCPMQELVTADEDKATRLVHMYMLHMYVVHGHDAFTVMYTALFVFHLKYLYGKNKRIQMTN